MESSILNTTSRGDGVAKGLYKTFGENVKFYRQSLGMSQIELADRLGISLSQVSKMEQGQVGASFLLLEKMGKIFRIPVDLLLRSRS